MLGFRGGTWADGCWDSALLKMVSGKDVNSVWYVVLKVRGAGDISGSVDGYLPLRHAAHSSHKDQPRRHADGRLALHFHDIFQCRHNQVSSRTFTS